MKQIMKGKKNRNKILSLVVNLFKKVVSGVTCMATTSPKNEMHRKSRCLCVSVAIKSEVGTAANSERFS